MYNLVISDTVLKPMFKLQDYRENGWQNYRFSSQFCVSIYLSMILWFFSTDFCHWRIHLNAIKIIYVSKQEYRRQNLWASRFNVIALFQYPTLKSTVL